MIKIHFIPTQTYLAPGKIKVSEAYHLDEAGFMFIRRCIQVLEIRGLEDEGIYRKSGVGTKISKLLALGLNQKESDDVFVDDKYRDLMESNTIASALKMYLRNLNEPLMTYQYHSDFIEAASKHHQLASSILYAHISNGNCFIFRTRNPQSARE